VQAELAKLFNKNKMNITEESKHMFSDFNGSFERIKHWSVVFDAPCFNKETIPSEDRTKLLVKLIEEELLEFKEELNKLPTNNNFKEVSLELGDLLWVVYRAFMELGISPSDVIKKIYTSNMSKACLTIKEAEETVQAYKNGTHPHKKGVKINAYYQDNRGYYIVKDAETNKILKSINSIKN
jgi:NTP pyrophosphatase (non-canonical NTP hydrolase)